MPFHHKNGLTYYSFSSIDQFGVLNAIFTRHGGLSEEPWASLNTGGTVGDNPEHVRGNLVKMFETVGRDFSSRYDGWQVHGDYVYRAEEPRPETQPHEKLDGIITNKKDVTVLMRFADCTPILLYDPINHIVGAVHAGWKGTILKIAGKAVARMREEYGTRPEDVVAGIGPSIGPDEYEVGEEVVLAAQRAYGDHADELLIQKGGSTHFDLWNANALSMREVGVEKIEIAGISTYTNVADWFSHRREKGKTGRFGAIIALPA